MTGSDVFALSPTASRTPARAAVTTLLLGGLVLGGAQPSTLAPHHGDPGPSVQRVADFDDAAGESPEGVLAHSDGHLYVGLKPQQQLVRLGDHGRTEVVATLPGVATGIGGLIGLTEAPDGSVLAALANGDPDHNGVWAIGADGRARRLAALAPEVFPNDLAVTPDGRAVLVTDSLGGQVLRVDLATGATSTWVAGDLLRPAPGAAIAVGANGLAFRSPSEVVVANTNRDSVVSIPVLADGSAGAAAVVEQVNDPDGVEALDGDLYVAQVLDDVVLRIGPDRSRSVVADVTDDLDAPVSLDADATGRQVLVTDSSITQTGERPGVSRLWLDVG